VAAQEKRNHQQAQEGRAADEFCSVSTTVAFLHGRGHWRGIREKIEHLRGNQSFVVYQPARSGGLSEPSPKHETANKDRSTGEQVFKEIEHVD
jgi:hypothetical protein